MEHGKTVIKKQMKKNVPKLRPGHVVRVHEKIQEGDKERIQIFEGLVIAVKHGKGLNGTFTVRKIGAGGIGVERIFPIHMPAIQKIEVLRQEQIRRAKLYYVRGQVGQKTKKRKTKLQELIFDMGGTIEEEEPAEEEKEESDKAADPKKSKEGQKDSEEPSKEKEASEEKSKKGDDPQKDSKKGEEKKEE